ncbi:RNA polymerase subunit sigma-70 [Prauserella sp. PE36]|uniref:Sigma-70 family RNA polymerase sigma factor n=1 Tax=Prauserella endophytica TaxID=1592324 RepID=A0ABY2SAN3_9PSEU|nr:MULTISPECIES: sigma-70 family RNA polymerase sigma factor [Prauserella]PXY29220.1 RNA polymerase subunit sigma-70 [Prauserella coralliicola]RBM21569.1 RNA polymerase subunit sigma-70 [Prauserella sp. PE36]TKG72910.1 sigma-70 family RNA polymerase sigma factor [Prauserella endophytica]
MRAGTGVPGAVAALDDEALVARARGGDMRAYEQLVRRYQGPMYRLALRMLAGSGEAEDVVQEVFLTAWRRLGQLHEDTAFVGWLYRSTTNRCLNVLRSRRPVADVDPDTTATRRVEAQPEPAAELNDQVAALLEALERLTPEQRACWLLREVHGRSYEEIAQIVRGTTAAVRGRIARARAQLAEVMRPWR